MCISCWQEKESLSLIFESGHCFLLQILSSCTARQESKGWEQRAGKATTTKTAETCSLMQKARSDEGYLQEATPCKSPGYYRLLTCQSLLWKQKTSILITASDFSTFPSVLSPLQTDFMDLPELTHFQSSRYAGATTSHGCAKGIHL